MDHDGHQCENNPRLQIDLSLEGGVPRSRAPGRFQPIGDRCSRRSAEAEEALAPFIIKFLRRCPEMAHASQRAGCSDRGRGKANFRYYDLAVLTASDSRMAIFSVVPCTFGSVSSQENDAPPFAETVWRRSTRLLHSSWRMVASRPCSLATASTLASRAAHRIAPEPLPKEVARPNRTRLNRKRAASTEESSSRQATS